MTKPSAILVCPMVPLRQMPAAEVDIVHRFLFDHLRGMSTQDDKRWRRLWGRIWAAEPGEGFQLQVLEERSGPFHKRHRVILEKLFASQERFTQIDKLHRWLKIGAGFVTFDPGKDHKPVAVPRSTNFEACSENEIREFHTDMVDFLYTERAQRFIFRQVKAANRPDMLETILHSHDDNNH